VVAQDQLTGTSRIVTVLKTAYVYGVRDARHAVVAELWTTHEPVKQYTHRVVGVGFAN
jgi:hypothetical protein